MAGTKMTKEQILALCNRAAVQGIQDTLDSGLPTVVGALTGPAPTVAIPEEVRAQIRPDLSYQEFMRVLKGDAVPEGQEQHLRTVPLPVTIEEQLKASIEDNEAKGGGAPAHDSGSGDSSAPAATLPGEVDQQLALPTGQAVQERPRFSFLTGPAGSGKTFLVKAEAANPLLGIQLCATTGIAAINLGEGVTTINSLLKYFDTRTLRDHHTEGFLDVQLKKLHEAGLREICLDEVSMMDGDALQILCMGLDSVNLQLDAEGADPIRLRLTGDFAQLPPVKAKYAFEVPVWQRFEPHTTVLQKIHRQANPEFLEALSACRRGSGLSAADYFARFCSQNLDYNFQGTTLLAKNAQVDRFNGTRYAELTTPEFEMRAMSWGKGRPEWKEIPPLLRMRKGALVMTLANKQREADEYRLERSYVYVNGDLATVEEFDVSRLGRPERPVPWVRLKRSDEVVPVNYVTRQNLIPLEKGRAKQLREEGHPERIKDKYEVIGEINYMPLRLAWATTVHKSQGLTLEHVQVDLKDGFFSTPGMTYVALSRVRSPNGLKIVGNPQALPMKFSVDPRVRKWL